MKLSKLIMWILGLTCALWLSSCNFGGLSDPVESVAPSSSKGINWHAVQISDGSYHVSIVANGRSHYIGHADQFTPVPRSKYSSIGVPGDARLAARYLAPGAFNEEERKAYVVLDGGRLIIRRGYVNPGSGRSSVWQHYKTFDY